MIPTKTLGSGTSAVRRIIAGGIIAVTLVACGGGSQAAGDPIRGAKLFSGETPIANGDAPSCIECHPIVAGEPGSIGTNLSNIGNRASMTVAGQSAEAYIRTSIVDPDAYLAGGFQEGIHFRGYGEALTQTELNDLVAYLLTLKSNQD